MKKFSGFTTYCHGGTSTAARKYYPDGESHHLEVHNEGSQIHRQPVAKNNDPEPEMAGAAVAEDVDPVLQNLIFRAPDVEATFHFEIPVQGREEEGRR